MHSEKPANIVQTSGQSSPQSVLFHFYYGHIRKFRTIHRNATLKQSLF